MLKAFMAYSRADEEYASMIQNALTQAGVEVLTVSQLPSDRKWQDITVEEILEADIGLVLLSPLAVQSLLVRTEVLKIQAQNKRLYAALVSAMTDVKWPDYLYGLRYIDLTSSENRPDQLEKLIQAMLNLEDLDGELVPNIEAPVSLTLKLPDHLLNQEELLKLIEGLANAGVKEIEIIDLIDG